MQINFVVLGKTEVDFVNEGLNEYTKRLKHYTKLSISVLTPLKNIKKLSIDLQKKKESKYIEDSLDKKSVIILLDEAGKEYSSPEFAKWLNKKMNGGADISFVIGGAYGFSNEIKKKYPQIALSKMTFSHQMVRLFFVEQLYRAFTILKGENYHH